MSDLRLALLGAGNMARGIARGALQGGLLRPDEIHAIDPDEGQRAWFTREGCSAAGAPDARLQDAGTIVLAVKPQVFPTIIADVTPHLPDRPLLVSIMAGLPCAKIEAAFASRAPRVVRVMPNLPMTLGVGMAGIYAGDEATNEDLHWVGELFAASGQCLIVSDEALMDVVTAVSGSGPAYYYLFTEALIRGGTEAGLSPDAARRLALQTCLGAARMMLESGSDPEELRANVTSKGGTTAAALDHLVQAGVPDAVAGAVKAAVARGRELGK